MNFLKNRKAAEIGFAVWALAILVTIVAGVFPPSARALDRYINGNTYQAVVRADPVTGSVFLNAAVTDRSGTVTAGNVSQVLMAANPNRRGFSVQNNGTVTLWINELGSPAAAGGSSISIAPGVVYHAQLYGASVASVNLLGTPTAAPFAAREW